MGNEPLRVGIAVGYIAVFTTYTVLQTVSVSITDTQLRNVNRNKNK